MFGIGDKILYPVQGAGIISEVEQCEVLGVLKDYYNLLMPIGNITIRIPVGMLNQLGIRSVIAKEEIVDVLAYFSDRKFEENYNWNKRYRENVEKLKTGSIYDAIDVYKVLAKREREKGLSTGERKMFANARQILFSELMLAGDYDLPTVETIVKEAISPYLNETA